MKKQSIWVTLGLGVALIAGIFSFPSQEFPDVKLKAFDSTLETYTLYGVGDSMLPVFKSGDVVRYQKCDFSKVEVGNVIVFWRGEHRVAHVVVRKEGEYLRTRGLNVESEDPEKISIDDYVGVLIVAAP